VLKCTVAALPPSLASGGLATSPMYDPYTGPRWALIRDLVGPDTQCVLDVGCRDRTLAQHLPRTTRYIGMDLQPPADVLHDAETPFPYRDAKFSCVVLADVLEHLDNPHQALDEAMRVSYGSVVVLLPNLFTLYYRLLILAGRTFDKYALAPDRQQDRHRWFMNFDQAAFFTRGRAEQRGWTMAREVAWQYPFRRAAPWLVYRAARIASGPNLWSWEYAARLEPRKATTLRSPDGDDKIIWGERGGPSGS